MVGLLAKKFHFQMRVTRGGVEEVVVVLVLRTLRHQQRLFHVGNIISSSSNNNNFYFLEGGVVSLLALGIEVCTYFCHDGMRKKRKNF